MAKPVRQYTKELHDKFDYWAAWLPGTRVQLGDCGTIDDLVFTPRASLANFDIDFDTVPDPDPMDILEHTSEGGVNVVFQVAGKNRVIPELPVGEAGAKITFTRDSAVVFVCRDVYLHRIADEYHLCQTIRDKVARREFPSEYRVVTQLVEAGSATVLISSKSGADITLRAEAAAGYGPLDLASLAGQFSIVRSNNIWTRIVSTARLTPLFRIIEVGARKRWGGWLSRLPLSVPRAGVPEVQGGRVAVESMSAEPAVGKPLAVMPASEIPVVLEPLIGKPIVAKIAGESSLLVQPLAVGEAVIGGTAEAPLGKHISVRSIPDDFTYGQPIRVELLKQAHFLLEPSHGDPMLVEPISKELIVEPLETEAFEVGYADFDEYYALST
jgi:hypothetical protein